MAQIKTITASTTEQAIDFGVQYQFVWFKNYGDTDCYVSDHSGIVADADGVAILKAGENVRLTPTDDTVYIKAASGTPSVEVHAQNYSDCPFKVAVKGGESSVTVEPILITHNGEYTAPEGKAYSPVTVNVPQGAEIITRTNWDLMTESQKQAKGLVAIQDSSTGFLRGDFVNGADYIQRNKYIPYSDEYKVLGVAYPDLFDASDNSWGYGTNPVLYTGTGGKPTLDTTENAVYFPTNTSDVVGYVDLGMVNTPFTVYVVMKSVTDPTGRLVSSVYTTSPGYLIMLNGDGNNVCIDSWGSGSSLGVSSMNYFVAAMTSSITTGYGYAYDAANDMVNSMNKSLSGTGRYITIGRTDVDPYVQYPAPTDVYVKYIAIVSEVENGTIIERNIRNLYQQFVGE